MDITQRNSSNEDLRCRACLSVDRRLFNIHDYKLADAFANIIGKEIDTNRPQHLCAYCGTLLLKLMSFKKMCLDSQQYLMPELLKEELDPDFIDRINHPNLTLTEITTIEFIDTPTDIKDEPNIDIVDIDGIINKADLKAETNDDKSKNNKTRKRKIGTVKKKKEIATDDDQVNEEGHRIDQIKIEVDVQHDYDPYNDVDTKKELEIDDDDNYDDVCEEIKMPVKKRKVKTKKVDLETEKIEEEKPKAKRKRKRKEEVTRKFRKAENDYMPVFDFASFESSYGVKIVVLSKEEQLEEIALRKKSRNFLESHFRCEQCGKGYDAEAAYSHHMVRHSPSEGHLACEICSVRFKRQCVRQRHQDVHRLKFMCNECNYVSRDRGQARNHHAMHSGKTYECQHCGKVFIKTSTYLSHVRLAHPALNTACELCGETFIGQVGLKMHKSRMHPEHKPQNLKCSACPAKFLNVEALNRHTDTTVPHVDLRPCEQCGENCASEAELERHVRETHSTESYRCEECGITFPTSSAFDVHHRRKHLNQRYSDAGRSKARKKYGQKLAQGQFVCEKCGKVMKNPTALRTHQRSHMDIKPFACNECPKSFTLKTSLQWHMRSHTGEKPYQCTDCPLAFSLKGNLDRHHRTAHMGIRASVPCPICGRVFTTNSCVRVHINTVHHGQPGPKRDRRKRNKFVKTPELDNKL